MASAPSPEEPQAEPGSFTPTSPPSGGAGDSGPAQEWDTTHYLVAIWATGLLAGAAWLMLGLLQLAGVARMSHQASSHLQAALDRQLAHWAWAPGFQVKLLRGRPGEIPMTWGVFQHVITLPPEADGWPAYALRTVLRHELGHVARRDFLWLTCARVCLLACWFHPLAWWLLKELARSAEHASDDLATASISGRAAYARNLVQVVSRCHTPGRFGLTSPFRLALAMARSSALRRRVEALMEHQRDRAPYRRALLKWQAPACALLVLALGSFTACKQENRVETVEPPVPAAGLAGSTDDGVDASPARKPDETRIYRLSEELRRLLLIGASRDNTAGVDPFASPPSPVPTTTVHAKTLERYATAARLHLINHGHVSHRADHPPQVIMPDIRTLIVTADEPTHNAIATYFAQRDSDQQVLIRSFILEVEQGWLPWSDYGLQEPSKDGLQVQGILSKEQGQKLLTHVQSDKSVQSLTAAPSVATRSGQRTHVDMVREFIYPTEFDPPQLAQPPTTKDGKPIPGLGNLPIFPTTPTAFEMRPVGLRMEFDPVVQPGNVHRIELYWEITDFLGFMNYGNPIKAQVKDQNGKEKELLISENKIQQPIFETLKLTTSFSARDGEYVVIGGIRPQRRAPTPVDSSAVFTPAMPKPKSADPSKPSMYILILQPTVVTNAATK
ncbi:M56 family metallopeptidase [Verrucomicrobium spinosum]|uniref:M56 family metallopeptidase n=1 Tax=Verrucomicrobium spinosum TaxID=2736 RepID=UPI00210A299E|nr:M56 family metallopeptidase [Verrucomicrobium spinosum]